MGGFWSYGGMVDTIDLGSIAEMRASSSLANSTGQTILYVRLVLT